MREGWRTEKLGDLCEIELGRTPARADATLWDTKHETGYVWLSIADLLNGDDSIVSDSKEYLSAKGAAESKIVRKGTLLVSFKLTIGRLAFAGRDLYTNEAIAALNIRGNKKLLNKFLFYYLQFFDWNKAAEGEDKIKGKTLNKAKLKELIIKYPTVNEQKRIIAILDEVFEGISIAVAGAEKNLAKARELFESILNKIDGKKDILGNLVEIRTGKLDANAAVDGGEYPFFTCSREIYAIDKFAFDCEAILLAGNNAVGDFNVKHYKGKFNAYQRTYVITTNQQKRVLYRFLYFQMRRSLKAFKAQSVGVGTKFLKLDMIKNMEIVLPSIGEQARLASRMDLLLENTERLEVIYRQKIETLAKLKQAFLQKAFVGELTAQSIEAVQEAA